MPRLLAKWFDHKIHTLVGHFHYRYRLQAIFPLRLGERGARLFASEEILVESSGQGFDQNRLTGGLAFPVEGFSGKVYYVLQSADRDEWENTHVLGFDFTYAPGGRVMMPGGS